MIIKNIKLYMVGDLWDGDGVFSLNHSFESTLSAKDRIFKYESDSFVDLEDNNKYMSAPISYRTYIDSLSLVPLSDYYNIFGMKKCIHKNSSVVHKKVKQLRKERKI